jgi:hypothetical protein
MSSIELEYNEQDILGEFIITEADENLSLGRIEPKNFFDQINQGDELILINSTE